MTDATRPAPIPSKVEALERELTETRVEIGELTRREYLVTDESELAQAIRDCEIELKLATSPAGKKAAESELKAMRQALSEAELENAAARANRGADQARVAELREHQAAIERARSELEAKRKAYIADAKRAAEIAYHEALAPLVATVERLAALESAQHGWQATGFGSDLCLPDIGLVPPGFVVLGGYMRPNPLAFSSEASAQLRGELEAIN